MKNKLMAYLNQTVIGGVDPEVSASQRTQWIITLEARKRNDMCLISSGLDRSITNIHRFPRAAYCNNQIAGIHHLLNHPGKSVLIPIVIGYARHQGTFVQGRSTDFCNIKEICCRVTGNTIAGTYKGSDGSGNWTATVPAATY